MKQINITKIVLMDDETHRHRDTNNTVKIIFVTDIQAGNLPGVTENEYLYFTEYMNKSIVYDYLEHHFLDVTIVDLIK